MARGWPCITLLGLVAVFSMSCVEDNLRDESGRIVQPGAMSLYSLRVGDCILEPNTDQVADVSVVPCDAPHELEVFALVEHPDGGGARYPGESRLAQASIDLCLASFERYVKRPYYESSLNFTAFYPNRDSWIGADARGIMCLLFDPASRNMHGSMRDSRR